MSAADKWKGHTPGPWLIDETAGPVYGDRLSIYAEGCSAIASVRPPKHGTPRGANAALIADAPLLPELVELAEAVCDENADQADIASMARAVLAKVGGGVE